MEFNLEQARLEQEIGRSLDLSKLNEALCEAQESLNVDTDGKGNRGNKYVSIKEMINATQPTLRKHKLVLTHVFNKVDTDTVLDAILQHWPSNQWIRSRIPLVMFQGNTANDTGQGIGCIITYFRRYTYSSILGLRVDEPDLDDANAPTSNQSAPKSESTYTPKQGCISEKQYKKLKALIAGDIEYEKELCKYFKINDLSELPWKCMDEALKSIEG